MARQVLPIVGAVVGGIYGGAAGARWGYLAGSIIGNAVDPQQIQGPKIGDNGVQTSAEGVIRPVVYGTGPVVGNVISRGNRQIKKKKQKQGKGGPVTVTERVYWTFAIRICEGPIAAVTRIWEDEKLVYDSRPSSPIAAESTDYAKRFTLYLGSETQQADPDLEVYGGMGNVPAHRGTAYIVFPNADLTDRRESIPNFRFEVVTVVAGATLGQGNAMVMFSQDTSARKILSPDGVDWGGRVTEVGLPRENESSAANILVANDRYIAVQGNGNPRYTDDGGATPWKASGGVTIQAGNTPRLGWYDSASGIIAWPGGNQTIKKSINKGADFFNIPEFIQSSLIVKAGNRWISYFIFSSEQMRFSSNDLATFSAAVPIPGFTSVSSRAANSNTAWLGGFNSNGQVPAVIRTSTGSSYTFEVLPTFVTGSVVSGMAWGAGRLVIGTNFGQIAYLFEGVWTLSADTVQGRVEDIAFNGSIFIIVSRVTASFSHIYTTETGATVTARRLSVGVGNRVAVAATLGPTQAIGAPVPLSGIVSALHERARVPPEHYNVAELTDMINGVVLANDFSCAAAIRSVIAPAFADASEYGRRIWFPKRGKPVIKTLTIDDLVDESEDSTRENAIEYPKKLHMFFQNPIIGYAPAKATATRSSPDARVVGEITTQIPWTIEDVTLAARINDKMMKVLWAEAGGEIKLTITDEHLDLVNGDCIGLALRGQVRRLRIVQIEDNPGTRALTLRADRQSAYTSNVTGIPLPPPVPPPPSIVGLTVSEFLDIPALADSDDDLHYLTAATGQTGAWRGALYQRSLDAGANYVDITEFNGNTAMGVLLDPITNASEHYTDTTNQVRVQLYLDDDIDSLTQVQFLSRAGAFAIEKAGGGWELMQYRDADEQGNRIVKLSTLLRGRLNSGTSSHAADARFVLFDLLRKVPANAALINQVLTHRAISFNTTPESAVPYTDTYTAKSQTEWPVASFSLQRIANTISGVIIPRHRFGTEDAPVRSINWQGYRISAQSSGQVQTVIQPEEVFNLDVTGYASPITVTVSQVNRFTGAGPSVSKDIA